MEITRALGNAEAMKPFVKREILPGPVEGEALDNLIRDGGDVDAPSHLHSKDGTGRYSRSWMRSLKGETDAREKGYLSPACFFSSSTRQRQRSAHRRVRALPLGPHRHITMTDDVQTRPVDWRRMVRP